MGKKILRKLTINRVALCTRGANPHADILLFKSDDPPSKGANDMKGKLDRKKLTKAEVQKLDALLDKMGVESDDIAEFDKSALPKADQRALDAIIAKAGPEDEDDDEQEEVELTAEAMAKALKADPKKAAAVAKALGLSAKSEDDEDEDEEEDDEIEKDDEDDDDEIEAVDPKILKSLPKAVQGMITKGLASVSAQLKKARAEAKTATEQAAAANKAAAIEKEARERATFVGTITPLIKNLPGETVKNAEVLYEFRKACSDKQWTTLEKMLKAGNTALSLQMEERGEDGEDNTESAELQLDRMAKELVEERENKITYQKAYAEVVTKNPKLYAQYRKESGAPLH